MAGHPARALRVAEYTSAIRMCVRARFHLNPNTNEENDMNVMGIVTDLIAGGVGGNIAGALLKKFDLGPIGNTVAGIVGGVGGGQLLGMLMSGGAAGATAAPSGGGVHRWSSFGNVGGAVSG